MHSPNPSFICLPPISRTSTYSQHYIRCHVTQSALHRPPVVLPRPLTTLIPTPFLLPRSFPVPFPPFIPPPPPSSRTLVWFRNDLRLHDHPALLHALQDSVPLPLFIFDPRHFAASDYGLERTGSLRANFLLQAVRELKQRLVDMGSDLIIRIGTPENVLPVLASECGAGKVLCHKEVGWEDAVVERGVHNALEAAGVSFESLWANTLYQVDDLVFGEDTPEDYSQFRQLAEEKGKVRDALRAPEVMPTVGRVDVGRVPVLGDLGVREKGEGMGAVGGEREGLERLGEYVRGGGKESVGRNGDFMCRIAPWLALGCISPRRIYHELAHVEEGVRSINYFELLWRDFFRFSAAKCNRERMMGNVGERRIVHEKIPVLGFL